MNETTSPDWEVLCAPFQSLFSRAGYRYFCVFVRVLVHLDGRLWVTQVVLARLLTRHWTNFYQFLRSPAWSVEAVAKRVYHLCLPHAQQAGRVFLALDDTVVTKPGLHFAGRGEHYDPMNHQHPQHRSKGHNWVCLAMLVPQGTASFSAWWLQAALYVPRKSVKVATDFATKLQLAAQMLSYLPCEKESQVIVVADSAYARHSLVQALQMQGKCLLSRLRQDAVCYDLPSERTAGQRGRPRQYGAKQKVADWAQQATWETVSLALYGQQRSVQIVSRTAILRRLGVTACLVAVRFGSKRSLYLFCTDLTLTPREIVSMYAARFAIETGFRDAKQHFGLGTYQVRNQTGFTRLVNLCLWGQTLLRLRCLHSQPTEDYGGWRKRLSYLTLSQQKRYSEKADRFSGDLTDRPAEHQSAA